MDYFEVLIETDVVQQTLGDPRGRPSTTHDSSLR